MFFPYHSYVSLPEAESLGIVTSWQPHIAGHGNDGYVGSGRDERLASPGALAAGCRAVFGRLVQRDLG